MKVIKKITATAFAVVMILSQGINASAAEVGTGSGKDTERKR